MTLNSSFCPSEKPRASPPPTMSSPQQAPKVLQFLAYTTSPNSQFITRFPKSLHSHPISTRDEASDLQLASDAYIKQDLSSSGSRSSKLSHSLPVCDLSLHVLIEPEYNVLVACITQPDASYRRVFSMLSSLRKEATRVALKKSRVKSCMKKLYSSAQNNAPHDSFQEVQNNMTDLRSQMISNIDKALDRGNSIDLLEEKTHLLYESSNKTRKKATTLKRRSQFKWILMACMLLFILLLLATILTVLTIVFLCLVPVTRIVHEPKQCLPWNW